MDNNFNKIDAAWNYRPVLALSVICLFSFFVWATFTQIDERIRATGKVIPAGNSKIIQHLEGGIISDILVTEGQRVSKDEILFYIKNERAESDNQELEITLASLEVKKTRLEAELKDDGELKFDENLRSKYAQIINSEQSIYNSKQAEFKQNTQGLQQQLRQRILKLNELDNTISNLRKELSVAKEQLDIKSSLRKKGAISRSQYLDSLSTVRNFETKIEKTQKEIPITKSELSEITNQIEEEKQHYFSKVAEELNDVEVEKKKVTERIGSYRDEVYRTAIKSPVDGVLNKIDINTIGGVIQPGGRLAEIIPINETMIIEGRISTNDRGKIWPGLKTIARITAYDYTIYGGVEGKLEYISANSFIDNQNQQYYQIRTSLDTASFNDELPVYPGMTADVNIVVGKVSVLYAILKPFWNIRDNAFREK